MKSLFLIFSKVATGHLGQNFCIVNCLAPTNLKNVMFDVHAAIWNISVIIVFSYTYNPNKKSYERDANVLFW